MATDTATLKKGTRVVVNTDLPGAPEGSAGKVGRSVGMTLTRYRVAFDNGVSFNSVAASKLVAEDEWDDWQANREQAEADAAASASAAAEAPAEAADGDGAPADDRLAKLLARSKAARERKAG
ncbi:MAG: hypothetical protein KDB35_23485 [Acidimicrobiales bacterium]|nr:hypothetical protein [Acidimicrobiales bacterium]MCB1014760.1 hypothetical protein [Acidimicrobiales bacterium]MCB9371204.1 hypothetical protein [Microthrixaceae bacterium]